MDGKNKMCRQKGGFTLPGESGFEELTLHLAEKWGADVIRDSDGTQLSGDILQAGYDIYSTVCVIRDHNDWAGKNPDKLQQTFLCTEPVTVVEAGELTIPVMKDFFEEQFAVNDSPAAMKYWQVYDRTANREVSTKHWRYDSRTQSVMISHVQLWHKYTVSFLAYRIWEEISMYNHVTNHWEKEHLMQIDPRYPEVQEYLLSWMRNWCESHPNTTVVRFTSMFYNFVWIWGRYEEKRNLFTDWGSYDFTVSDRALDEFYREYGYSLTAEDFINQGKLHVTHMPADQHKLDWMAFCNDFVISFGKRLIDIVHTYGKKAYVFYDDSWVGIEPYNGRFREFGFDGLIKCVFSGFEARLCAGVDIPVHELRLHPYLFPVGLGGLPTFMEGGDPAKDARQYWIRVRRALLRKPVDRIGLGGYLHLVEPFPDFCDAVEQIADEFRMIRELHRHGSPYEEKIRVGVLHFWGKLRSWTLSGHFHETWMHDLIHINEALSGLPVSVSFLSFEDVREKGLDDVDILINAGKAGDAWSGGECWKDDSIVELLTEWVFKGGVFLGVNEPSAVPGYDTFFRMAHVLGIDRDTGERVCHGKWRFQASDPSHIIPEGTSLEAIDGLYLTERDTHVLLAEEEQPILTEHIFGKGKGIYLSSYHITNPNIRLLYQLLRYAGKNTDVPLYTTENADTECAYFPEDHRLIVINNSDSIQKTAVRTEKGDEEFLLPPFGSVTKDYQ